MVIKPLLIHKIAEGKNTSKADTIGALLKCPGGVSPPRGRQRKEAPMQPDSIRIPLHARDGSIRAHAVIDECDAHFATHRWRLHSAGYAKGRIDGQDALLHRAILGLARGDGLEVDHIDGDKLNCRRSNLTYRDARTESAELGPESWRHVHPSWG